MTLSKVPLNPPVIKLKGLKILPHEIQIIEEQINGEEKVKKENMLILLQNVGTKIIIIVIDKKIRMKLNRSLRR